MNKLEINDYVKVNGSYTLGKTEDTPEVPPSTPGQVIGYSGDDALWVQFEGIDSAVLVHRLYLDRA